MIRLALIAWLALCGVVHAQLSGGVGGFPGPGTVHSAGAAYVGPNDAVSGITSGGSVYRAYAASYANGTNPLADLVDSSTGLTAICTLRVATTGFADVANTYCGGQTPANACAAAAGGSCTISKVYDQPGGSTGFLQATPANMPGITFSDINGLPAINCGNGTPNLNLQTASTFTSTTVGLVVVYKRTAAFTTAAGAFGAVGGPDLGGGTVANNARITNGTSINVSGATDSQYNGLVGSAINSPNGALNVNGVDTTGLSDGSGNLSASALRFCRANATQIGANITEGWFYTGGLNATNRGDLYTNMHGTSGYNGAF